jgi:hypothetical protein
VFFCVQLSSYNFFRVSPISISDSDNEDNGQKELDILVQSLESPAEEDEP